MVNKEEQNLGSRIGTNYRDDGDPRALYYWPYREVYEALKDQLVPGQEVSQDMEILYVGNNTLLPTSYDLKNSDRQPLGEVDRPGKSAHISFSREMDVICGALFDRPCRRTDHAYIISAQELRDKGFHPIYAPTPACPLHIRVIHDTHIKDPTVRDIPFRAKTELVSALQSRQVP